MAQPKRDKISLKKHDSVVHYVLGQPDFFLNTVGDIHLLPKVLDVASRFWPVEQSTIEVELARLDLAPLFV